MTEKIPKGGTTAWYSYYQDKTHELGEAMELPEEVIYNACDLWADVAGRVGRAPLPLVVDCLYICAKLSGNRVSIKATKRLTNDLWGKRIDILPARRGGERRWVWSRKGFILSFYPDELAWDDFVSAWKDKVVDESYFDEE